MKKIDINIKSVEVIALPRRLKCNWTVNAFSLSDIQHIQYSESSPVYVVYSRILRLLDKLAQGVSTFLNLNGV